MRSGKEAGKRYGKRTNWIAEGTRDRERLSIQPRMAHAAFFIFIFPAGKLHARTDGFPQHTLLHASTAKPPPLSLPSPSPAPPRDACRPAIEADRSEKKSLLSPSWRQKNLISVLLPTQSPVLPRPPSLRMTAASDGGSFARLEALFWIEEGWKVSPSLLLLLQFIPPHLSGPPPPAAGPRQILLRR